MSNSIIAFAGMVGDKMAAITDSTVRQDERIAYAYAPSWVDRFTDWVRLLPVPAWSFYLVVGLALSLTRTIAAWSDNSYPVGTFFPIHIFDGLDPIYLLFVLHYLDNMARRALADFRPVLTVPDEDYESLRYRIATMPSRPVLLLSLVGAAIGLAYIPFFLTGADIERSKYLTSPLATTVDLCLSGLSGLAMIVFAYHTIHQLRTVARICTHHTNVSIFDMGPLYALSRVGAMTTVALLALTYAYLSIYGNWQIYSPTNGILVAAFVLIALATFVWPLFGAHKLLQQEKDRRKSEISRRFEDVSNELHRRTDAGDYSADIGNINNAIDGLIKEQDVVAKSSTWPWDPEAVRAVLTALLLPTVLWLITRILERLGL